jgi:hypothetical protein
MESCLEDCILKISCANTAIWKIYGFLIIWTIVNFLNGCTSKVKNIYLANWTEKEGEQDEKIT